MPMSLALELEFAIVTDVPFAVTILKKRNTHKLPEVCQIEILWKISLPTHSVKGCQRFAAIFSQCPRGLDRTAAELCQGFTASAPRFLPEPLGLPLHPGVSWP